VKQDKHFCASETRTPYNYEHDIKYDSHSHYRPTVRVRQSNILHAKSDLLYTAVINTSMQIENLYSPENGRNNNELKNSANKQ